jgi:hypothetical protein
MISFVGFETATADQSMRFVESSTRAFSDGHIIKSSSSLVAICSDRTEAIWDGGGCIGKSETVTDDLQPTSIATPTAKAQTRNDWWSVGRIGHRELV